MPVKLGLTARRHIVVENAAVMEQEGYEAKKEVRKLKKELTACRKIIKEFQIVSNTPMELKKQASFHEGWEVMKNLLKEEMMATIEKLASHIFKLIEEVVEIRELKSQMSPLLEKLDTYLPIITQLEQTYKGRCEKLVYCHEFMYQHDWLTHALEKCNGILKVRIPLRKEVEEQMSQYLYPLKFQGDDNNVWRKESVLIEAHNLIDEHLEVEDLNLLKASQTIHHERRMVLWKSQMQATSKKIGDYLGQNSSMVGMISRGVRKTMVFLEETIDSYGLTEEEWNIASASAGSNLA